MIKLLFSVALVALLAGCAKTDTVAAADGEDKDNGLICVREKVTGSLIKRKVCRSAAQIEQEREHSQKMLERSSNRDRALSGN